MSKCFRCGTELRTKTWTHYGCTGGAMTPQPRIAYEGLWCDTCRAYVSTIDEERVEQVNNYGLGDK